MARTADVRVIVNGLPNAVLVLRDEEGREWLAATFLGNLIRYEDGEQVESMGVESMKDRAFMLHEFKLIHRG